MNSQSPSTRAAIVLTIATTFSLLAGPARSTECRRDIGSLADAQTYAECLEGELAATRELFLERTGALVTELAALRSQFTQSLSLNELKVNELYVSGSVTAGRDIRTGTHGQSQVSRLASYYYVGGNPSSFSVGKPQSPPRYGGEFFAWVEFQCVYRGGKPSGLLEGYAYATAPDGGGQIQYSIDPKLARNLNWTDGELFVTTMPYQDCFVTVRHTLAP